MQDEVEEKTRKLKALRKKLKAADREMEVCAPGCHPRYFLRLVWTTLYGRHMLGIKHRVEKGGGRGGRHNN